MALAFRADVMAVRLLIVVSCHAGVGVVLGIGVGVGIGNWELGGISRWDDQLRFRVAKTITSCVSYPLTAYLEVDCLQPLDDWLRATHLKPYLRLVFEPFRQYQ